MPVSGPVPGGPLKAGFGRYQRGEQDMSEASVKSFPRVTESDFADELPEFYIEAQTSLVGRPLRTLKSGDSFAVLDAYGDLGIVPDSPEGLFYRDTRHLSRFELRFDRKRPLLLSS